MSLVLDNSVSMRWCFADGSTSDLAYADRVLESLRDGPALVPSVWPLEVANVVLRAEARQQITPDTSAAFLAQLRSLRIEIDPGTAGHALVETLEIARRHRLSAYDSAYLELALRRQLALATLDAGLRKAARRVGVELF